ncbi:hypothetical protein CANCADRAFT_24200 [Tortispora caseinolytica NRRL Y-17796]|uniref:Fe2OG dioxygenase domain-containing protein n=1 Tax=Tortispora caseinolytica NRRL Y-17796 TaxID=767744 RepID=A0A1E4TGG3_9ASCO|nr:hypothetical protein CANCADRAFT_24200 [Tortispora caseinolytica NRRL Y-17796]
MISSLPVIDLNRDTPEERDALLADLKDALFRIGFIYLKGHGVEDLARKIADITPGAFDIPQEKKDEVSMVNSPHFVGYTRLGAETTALHTDRREQYDFGSIRSSIDYGENSPAWNRVRGPSQFPDPKYAPVGFRETVEAYISAMDDLAKRFIHLVSESLGLPPDGLDKFVGDMHRLKLVKYPPLNEESVQGVGPHKDSSNLFTFVLQDKVGGLEVLGPDGNWIPATPMDDTFVVNIAQGFEALTGGKCGATTHQVIAPAGVTRYSIPYFYGVRLDLTRDDIDAQTELAARIPEPTDFVKRSVDVPSEFIQPEFKCFGEAHLRNRIVSHKDVGKRWYPELYLKYVGAN